jgi:FtsZ-interacting cell division protein ZipA
MNKDKKMDENKNHRKTDDPHYERDKKRKQRAKKRESVPEVKIAEVKRVVNEVEPKKKHRKHKYDGVVNESQKQSEEQGIERIKLEQERLKLDEAKSKLEQERLKSEQVILMSAEQQKNSDQALRMLVEEQKKWAEKLVKLANLEQYKRLRGKTTEVTRISKRVR